MPSETRYGVAAGSFHGEGGACDPADQHDAVALDRYADRGLLGVGGMSVVRRVWDHELERTAAMKFPRRALAADAEALARFTREARITAGLQHPGVIPVYDHGVLGDGRPYFTMAEVHGATLGDGLAAAPLRRRMDVYARVCDTLAFAHAQGVVHGDLKPANVMLGRFGEVLVLDWGIARSAREAHAAGPATGTPAYMAPEQARGQPPTALSDVYTLGAILHELVLGESPFVGRDEVQILAMLRAGDVPECSGLEGAPDELVELINLAMNPEPAERGLDAGGLTARVNAWLDRDRRRELALACVARADRRLQEAAAAERGGARRASEAQTALVGVPAWAGEDVKAAAWRLQDEARSDERRAGIATVEAIQLLHEALSHDPACREAQAKLADHYRAEQARAEARRDLGEAERLAVLVRAHGGRRHARWLEGTGAVTLVTDPPGAMVECRVFVPVGRRLADQPFRHLGTTPLRAVPLPMGSYVLVIRHPERVEVRYPVYIGRTEHWDGTPPEGGEPYPIRLPLPGELPEGACYVPAGWATVGGDDLAMFGQPAARVWVGGFVVDRAPITNRGLLALLDRLEAEGRGDERRLPRARGAQVGQPGAAYYARDPAGHWRPVTDADGDTWELDWPVLAVDWWDVAAIAGWRAGWDGVPWRLVSELEREKAARGADGRLYPWGDHFDPSFCCMRESHAGRPLPSPVTRAWADVSVYGVTGLAGNVRDWCLEAESQGGARVVGGRLVIDPPDRTSLDPRMIRGGSWVSPPAAVRAASRQNARPTERSEAIGFRHAFGWG